MAAAPSDLEASGSGSGRSECAGTGSSHHGGDDASRAMSEFARSTSSRSEDAELVALRIGQNDPSLVALSDIGIRRTEVDEASYFSFLVDRTEIEMKPGS